MGDPARVLDREHEGTRTGTDQNRDFSRHAVKLGRGHGHDCAIEIARASRGQRAIEHRPPMCECRLKVEDGLPGVCAQDDETLRLGASRQRVELPAQRARSSPG